MQNVSWRKPGTYTWRIVNSLGQQTYYATPASSLEFILRTQTGYTGPKPKTKPMPIHAYTLNCQNIRLTRSLKGVYANGSVETVEGPMLATTAGGATFFPSYSWTNLYNAALSRLNDKVRGSLDVSIDLAEASKTLKMFRVTDQVVDHYKTLTKRFGLIKMPSNAWLMYTYGIKPLLQTIYGIADENVRVVINRTQRYSAQATEFYYPTSCQIGTAIGVATLPVKEGRLKVSLRLGIDVRTDQFDLSRWSSLNPVSIAWELLPYSFVVDWFLNVGGYLRNLETYSLNANKFRSGYKTTLVRGAATLNLSQSGNNGTYVSHTNVWDGAVRVVDIQRSLLQSYPAPTLPSFDFRLGSSRLLSAAALLGQLLGRRK